MERQFERFGTIGPDGRLHPPRPEKRPKPPKKRERLSRELRVQTLLVLILVFIVVVLWQMRRPGEVPFADRIDARLSTAVRRLFSSQPEKPRGKNWGKVNLSPSNGPTVPRADVR